MNILKYFYAFLAFGLFGLCYKAEDMLVQNSHFISVNGLSVRTIESDEASWVIKIVNETDDLKDAKNKRTIDKKLVLDFLKKSGFKSEEISEAGCDVENVLRHIYSSSAPQGTKKYKISDSIIVNSDNVQRVKTAIASISEIDAYIENKVEYQYKGIDNLRVEMVNEATKDAMKRATNIALNSNTHINGLRNLTTGAFTISSSDVSLNDNNYYGNSGETTFGKRVRVVVHATFNIK